MCGFSLIFDPSPFRVRVSSRPFGLLDSHLEPVLGACFGSLFGTSHLRNRTDVSQRELPADSQPWTVGWQRLFGRPPARVHLSTDRSMHHVTSAHSPLDWKVIGNGSNSNRLVIGKSMFVKLLSLLIMDNTYLLLLLLQT